jgi:hypothetical protein
MCKARILSIDTARAFSPNAVTAPDTARKARKAPDMFHSHVPAGSIAARNMHVMHRLTLAQNESRELARDALQDAGRALSRRDRAGFRAACILAAQHYRNAGEATLAAHWNRRANI